MGVVRHPLDHWVDPVVVWLAVLDGVENSFWLDSGPDATAGRSWMGASSRIIDSLAQLDDSLSTFPIVDESATPSFRLGWVGWLGYELRGETMGEPVRASSLPDVALMFVDRAVEFDHAAKTVTLVSLDDDAEWFARTIELLGRPPVATVAAPGRHRRTFAASATWRYDDDIYLAMIEECQRAIAAGDAYQLCLTTEATVEGSFDPFEVYRALRLSSPTHHGGLIRIGDLALVSSSPEQFLSVSPSRAISSSPIKGTRPRSTDADIDAALALELLESDKERAENLMIVDLMRNDIQRVSVVGSVSVPSLLVVETYAHVHQLVSTVVGQLAPGVSAVDAVVATFPAGSMTGAPKRSATRILDAIESRPRGIYSGAFGYFSLDGSVDLAMVIRSIVVTPTKATIGAGGGITALSVPAEELAEVRVKAAALLRVLGVPE
jgi:para-aminobenzoate synthetase component 1